MHLTRIHRIANHRIFQNFTWPADLPDFARFNLIYGWNGTGKTTLSNLLRHLTTRAGIAEGDAEFRVGQHAVSNVNLATVPLPPVRVFNRQFVGASVFEVPNTQFSPIYFLGEDSVEKQKLIEAHKGELAKSELLLGRQQTKHKSAASDYEAFCTDQARIIRELLTAPGSSYNNYDKRAFKAAVQSLTVETFATHLLDETGKARLKKAMGGKALERIAPISTAYPDIVALTRSTQQLLERSVTSKIIESLAANPAIAAWVGSGLQLHTAEQASDACHFCGQHLPAERLRHLEAHFNDEFKRFQGDLAAAATAVGRAKEGLQAINAPDKRLLYDHLREEHSKAAGTLAIHRGNVALYLDALHRALEEKKASPFKPLDLLPFVGGTSSPTEPMGTLGTIFSAIVGGAAALGAMLGKDAVTKINGVIEAHNLRTENFNAEIAKARKSLETCYAAEAFEKYQAKASLIKTAASAVEENDAEIKATKAKIAALEAEIRQHHRPASELTAEIQAYLGRDELALVTSDTGYRITRYGQPASNLSEGERTAIALLYFLKSLRDTSFDMKTGIVVIDDPVSSLDANALFSAFGYLQDRTKDAGQLFVLTHNFAFFRLVKNWFNKQPGQNKGDITKRPSRFYMLATARTGDRRTAALAALDPLLHEFESEYHYLFKRVHEEANRPDVQIGLAENYGMPNITRRLLEAFLAFRIPGKANELYQQLELIEFDSAAKTRILRFLHTHSHHGQIAEPEHDLSILAETPAVLRDVLALIEKFDGRHYAGMLTLVSPVPAPSARVPAI